MGLTNVVKVFKMQQMNGQRLEKLRGGGQDRLIDRREGHIHVPLIIEEPRRKLLQVQTQAAATTEGAVVGPTPYKDVLLGRTSQPQ